VPAVLEQGQIRTSGTGIQRNVLVAAILAEKDGGDIALKKPIGKRCSVLSFSDRATLHLVRSLYKHSLTNFL
jgi:hypothetical protein